jgi:hypothetical protein
VPKVSLGQPHMQIRLKNRSRSTWLEMPTDPPLSTWAWPTARPRHDRGRHDDDREDDEQSADPAPHGLTRERLTTQQRDEATEWLHSFEIAPGVSASQPGSMTEVGAVETLGQNTSERKKIVVEAMPAAART